MLFIFTTRVLFSQNYFVTYLWPGFKGLPLRLYGCFWHFGWRQIWDLLQFYTNRRIIIYVQRRETSYKWYVSKVPSTDSLNTIFLTVHLKSLLQLLNKLLSFIELFSRNLSHYSAYVENLIYSKLKKNIWNIFLKITIPSLSKILNNYWEMCSMCKS